MGKLDSLKIERVTDVTGRAIHAINKAVVVKHIQVTGVHAES